MRSIWMGLTVVVVTLLVGVGGGMYAQQRAQAPKATGPVLSDLETAYVQIVALSEQLANCKANQLAEVKQATDVRADAIGRIERAHPGYTVDWATGALVPQSTPKAP